jgi:Domain of unknown function (DUF6473)/Sulfotransferase family
MVNVGYQLDDQKIIDYELWEVPGLPMPIRGPAFELNPGEYVAAIGAAQTFGRFTELPYCEDLAKRTGANFLNLGFSGAGPTFFTDRSVLMDLINKSRFTVIQVMSGRSVSNSSFAVQENQGIVVPRWGRTNQTPTFAENAYAEYLEKMSKADAIQLRTEIRLTYIDKMRELIRAIHVPKVLLYWSTRSPEYGDGLNSVHDYWGGFPHFVNQAVVDELSSEVDYCVEAITDEGLPQPLVYKDTGEPYEMWSADKFPNVPRRDANFYYPSPQMHKKAADLLLPVVTKLASSPPPVRESPRPAPLSSSVDKKRHVLVHFHIFKCAGMSVDSMLSRSFGDGFESFDLDSETICIDERTLLDRIERNPRLEAISCHQLRPPISGNALIRLHPFLFLRDPIDRVHSLYYYERMGVRRQTSTQIHTIKANELNFRQFVEWCLEKPGSAAPIANYQTRVCSVWRNGSTQEDWDNTWADERNLRQALGFLSTLLFVGVVEKFAECIHELVATYKYLFPELQPMIVQENTTREHSALPLAERHTIIRNALGEALYYRLMRHNALDIALYKYASERLSKKVASPPARFEMGLIQAAGGLS